MIPPALWLIALPIGAAPVVYLFRRVGVGAVVAAIVALFSAWLTMRLPPGLALNILGRSIALDPLSQVILSLLFITSALLFLISSTAVPFIEGFQRKTIDVSVLSGAGRTFYPVSLAILGFLAAASLSRHLGITAVFIEAAVISAVFIIQGTRLASTRAAQRFLVLMSLATPLLLLASSRIDSYRLSASLPLSDSLQQTALLIGIGFALWLAVFPFHGWMTATAAEASPASAAFILTAFPAVALLTLLHLVADTPWLVNETALAQTMVIAGLVTACVGGLLTGLQRGLSGLMGYAALYDLGCILAVFGAGGQAMISVVLVGLVVRALALTLIAAGASAILLQLSGEGFSHIKGAAAKLPLATTGLMIGGLSLAGAPLTIGFAQRWQLFRSLALLDDRWPILLILAGLGVAAGYLRALYTLLPSQKGQTERLFAGLQEPRLLIIITVLLSLVCIGGGLFPGLVIEPIRQLAATVFVPVR